jgi:hypothetical protein
MKTVLYPIRTEPAVSPSLLPDNNLTSRWYQQLQEPVRRRSDIGAKASGLAYFNHLPYAGQDAIGWYQPLAEPIVKLRHPITDPQEEIYSYNIIIEAETITVDKWFATLSEPYEKSRRFKSNLQLATIFGPRYDFDPNGELDWYAPLVDPVKVKPRLATGSQLYEAREPLLRPPSTGWYSALSEPIVKNRPFRTNLNPDGPDSAAHYPTVPWDWRPGLVDPVKLPLRLKTASQQALAYGPRYDFDPTAQIGWFSALSEPSVKALEPTTPHLEFSLGYTEIIQENVTVDKWYNPLNIPSKLSRILSAASQQSLMYGPRYDFDANSQIGWHSALSEPRIKSLRRPPHHLEYIHSFYDIVIPEVILADKWYHPLSTPVKLSRQLSTAQQQAIMYGPRYDFDATAQIGWGIGLSLPVKLALKFPAASQQAIAYGPRYDFDAASQVGWYSSLTDPSVKTRRRPPYHIEYNHSFFTLPEVVTVDKWFRGLEIPVMLPRPVPDQQALAFGARHDFDATSQIGWYRSLLEPTRWRGLFPASQQFAAPAPFPQVPWDWRPGLVDPVKLRNYATRLQSDLHWNSLVIAAPEVVTVDKWYMQLVDLQNKARRKVPQFPLPIYTHRFLATDAIGWYSQFSEPLIKKRPYHPGRWPSQVIGLRLQYDPRQIDWYRALDIPTRRKVAITLRSPQPIAWTAIEIQVIFTRTKTFIWA